MSIFLLHKTIEILSNYSVREQCFDTIFYVESAQNAALNAHFRSEQKALTKELNNKNQLWLPAKIKIISADNKQFPAHNGRARIYCGILPSAETCNKGCAFLSADIEDCPVELLPNAISYFYRDALMLDDKILENCHVDSGKDLRDDIILPTSLLPIDDEQDCVCIRLGENAAPISGFQDILSIAKHLSAPSHLSIVHYPYRLVLTDYDNLEITMPHQSLAFYILLLRHPEGILHKDMPDYKDEFESIYLHITNRGNLEKLKRSVDGLLNLENDNALRAVKFRCNQKIEQALPERLRKPYMIQGESRELRRILLDRKLLEMSDILR